MASYETDLRKHQAELIRKALKGSLFVAPSTAGPIVKLTSVSGVAPNEAIELDELPVGYDDAGLLTGDGVGASNEQSTSDVTSWGYTSPTRSDVVTDTTTLSVTMQETKALTLGIYTGKDIAAIKATPGTGEVRIDKAARPTDRYYRGLLLAVDESDSGEVYIARYFPKIKVNGRSDQSFGGGDEPISYGVTFQTYVDDAAGFSESWLFGGPGWFADLEKMGIDLAA